MWRAKPGRESGRTKRLPITPAGSFLGMLRSSMKTTLFLPAGGPYTPRRRFSSFESNKSWSSLTCVLAERLMNIGSNVSGASCWANDGV